MTAGIRWCVGTMASNLVKRRMAIVTGHSYVDGGIRISYPPEPALSIAACSHLCAGAGMVLKRVQVAQEFAWSAAGEIGEFLARVLLLLSNYDPRESSFQMVAPRPVDYMVKMMVGEWGRGGGGGGGRECEWERGQGTGDVLRGWTCFTRFTRAKLSERRSAEANIAYGLYNHSALAMPSGHYGVDLVVPVVCQSGRLGCISVQVKSWRQNLNGSDRAEIVRKFGMSSFGGLPSLKVVLNLASCGTSRAVAWTEDVLIVDGFGAAFPGLWERYPGLREVCENMVRTDRYLPDIPSDLVTVKEQAYNTGVDSFFECSVAPCD
jgi:hypothetical protein